MDQNDPVFLAQMRQGVSDRILSLRPAGNNQTDFEKVVSPYDRVLSRAESGRNLELLVAPLDFVSRQRSVQLFQVVNLLFLVTAPEIGVGKQSLIVVPFHPLSDDKILPKATDVAAQVGGLRLLMTALRIPVSTK